MTGCISRSLDCVSLVSLANGVVDKSETFYPYHVWSVTVLGFEEAFLYPKSTSNRLYVRNISLEYRAPAGGSVVQSVWRVNAMVESTYETLALMSAALGGSTPATAGGRSFDVRVLGDAGQPIGFTSNFVNSNVLSTVSMVYAEVVG